MDDLQHLARIFSEVVGPDLLKNGDSIAVGVNDRNHFLSPFQIERAQRIANAILDGRLK